ncbi:N-6 DNA methylase [Micromonospora sp. WMMD956]|uniref:HsdM family class I SAM-dependent methyltransferase n=1 Tax=Micromonospora sp. WMMD956 TaxID=3016108 RepID=UPI0024170310|nr:N-6 DNA methylase [Micromonospora sp. WMMD956]MDG4817523.1 N-6 DNA methylase [Micromonospora sp. WMMD956]
MEFGDVVLVLLYMRGSPAWQVLADGSSNVERTIVADWSANGEDVDLLYPLLQPLRKTVEARQMAPLLELIDRIDPDEVPLPQVFGAVLDQVSGAVGKGGGGFYTPRAITGLASGLLEPAQSDRVLDPCCKTGGFLAAIADRLIGQGEAVERLTVAISDYSGRSCALAYLNLRLRGVVPQVLPRAAESLPSGAPESRYDVVTANPPFNLSNWSGDRGLGGWWRYGAPPAHNSNFAWLQYIFASLNPGGRAAVVMPYGAGLSENTQERNIRAAMLDDGVVSAVIALPGQMFPGTDIPVALWLLRRSLAGPPEEVLFVDATEMGSVQQRPRRTLSGADIDKIVETYRGWREHRIDTVAGFAAAVPLERIRSDGYRLNPRVYVTPLNEAPDLQTRARQVDELTQRLDRLAEQAARLDRTIEAHLKELSL